MPVSEYALCSLQDVKDYYTMIGADSNKDGVLESLIDQFTEVFEQHCTRKFKSREHTEYHNGTGTLYLYPNHYPITSVSGIWSSTSWDWNDDTLIDPDTYAIRYDDKCITRKSTVFAKHNNGNIKIIYTAGYSDIPKDLKLVCIEEVVRAFKNRKGVDVLSKTAADGSTTRYTKDLMPTTIRVLKSYKKMRVI